MIRRFENLDISSIITPINADKLRELLVWSNYDRQETEFLFKGFTEGFDIEYQGPEDRQDRSKNLPFRIGNERILWNKIMKEVEAKRVAGPFSKNSIPFDNYIQSPLGLVPKSGNKARMIFHLSYDFVKYNSVNHFVPDKECSVKYHDLDTAVQYSLEMLQHYQVGDLFYAKTDLSNAYRMLGLNRRSFRWVLMQARDPETGETKIFVEKALPFGGSISCAHFQRFSNSLKHIVEFFTQGPKICLVNYLDDFLFIQTSKEKCNQLVRTFMEICHWLKVEVAENKTEYGSDKLTFLGILLDGKNKVLCLPEEKRVRAINLLKVMVDRRKATVKELKKLAGYLNFLNRAIFPGRVFTRRMYSKFANVIEGKRLRDYHHINLDKEFKEDCKTWLEFLDSNKIMSVCRPFVDLSKSKSARTLDFYTDASASLVRGGFEGYYGTKWMAGCWSKEFLINCKPSIEYLELAALVMVVFCWGHLLKNLRIKIFCDNKSV